MKRMHDTDDAPTPSEGDVIVPLDFYGVEQQQQKQHQKRKRHPSDFSALDNTPSAHSVLPDLLPPLATDHGSSNSSSRQPPSHEPGYREIEMIKHDLTGVQNQHFVRGGRRACVGISVLTLFHLYRRLTKTDRHEDDPFLPTIDEWNELLDRGVELYERWRRAYVTSDQIFPTVEEVLGLVECRPFLALFAEPPVEVSGLVRKTKLVESVEGSLTGFLIRMRRETSPEGQSRRPVCALVVVPVNVCVSVLCKPEGTGKEVTFFVFDSHGGSERHDAAYCELVQFFMAKDTAAYLIQKYQIDSIADLDPELAAYCTEEEIASNYSFHARLFK
jgi:hypothetical protein